MSDDIPKVLYVCVHNAGRSVAATVLTNHHGHGRVRVASAGTVPAAEINPVVAEVLRERGLDPDHELPQRLTDDAARDADVIVTMGCGDACPVFPDQRHVDWPLPDPAGLPIDDVRPIVDEIDRRVRALLAEVAAPGSE